MSDPQRVIVIPARHASTRFPGKPLAGLRGATGETRSLIARTWAAAAAVPDVDAVWVATDDAGIAAAAQGFGARVVMTDPACANGTERCADALARLGIAPRVVVNLQGDAPLIPPDFVTALLAAVEGGAQVATPVLQLDSDGLARFLDDRRNGLVGGTTAVMNARGEALYFSKEVLPFTARQAEAAGQMPVFHHVGAYAFTADALARYHALGPTELELREGLEQLRFLYHGIPVACVPVTAPPGRQVIEVNNPGDIALVEAELRAAGMP